MNQPIILFEDETVLVLNKPSSMSVHATNPGEDTGTVVEWLEANNPKLDTIFPKTAGEIWRPGIVHRLDKDTSGVMVVAKTAAVLLNLQNQFRNRTTQKIYRALVAGKTDESGEFSGAIARSDADPTHQEIRRLSFSWSKGKAREAATTYCRLAVSGPTSGVGLTNEVSLVELTPRTGRMHQLRVQLADAGWPILGDERYGTKLSQQLSAYLQISRQMLHARRLSFRHPDTNEIVTFCADYPEDFANALQTLSFPVEAC